MQAEPARWLLPCFVSMSSEPLMPNSPHMIISINGLSPRQIAWNVETDGGARRDDLGGRRRILRDVRHRSVPGYRPGRRVLRLPDLSGAGRRTTGLGNLTVDQLDTTLKSLFPNEAYVLVRDQIAHIQGEPPLALLSLGVVIAL